MNISKLTVISAIAGVAAIAAELAFASNEAGQGLKPKGNDGALVWDATESGRLMTADGDLTLFTGVKLAEIRPARCWFNKARRRRADGTWTMCNGEGRICHVRRAEDGASLVMQCQLFDSGWTKCVKFQLKQSGDDIVGRIVYAKYCTEKKH